MKKYILSLAVLMAWLGAFDAVATTFDVAEIPVITTVMNNGPTGNRINIVFLSEAYTASQKEIYFSDVRIAVEEMFKYSPYKEYKKYFNVQAIWVPSKDSLLSVIDYGQTPKTYFGQWGGLGYDTEKIHTTVKSFFGGSDKLVIDLLIGDEKGSAGGGQSDDPFIIGFASVPTGRVRHDTFYTKEIFADMNTHEFTHAFAGLADEYSGLVALKPGVEDIEISWPFRETPPNVTTEKNRDSVKWKHWIIPSVPVPTPSSASYADKIGLFEGAGSFSGGLYKPKQFCAMGKYHPEIERMHSLCEVCRENVVKTIYKYIDPTAEFTSDVGENTTIFTVNPPQPTDHSLSVVWKVDGEVVARNTNTFPVTDTEIGYGRHKLRMEIVDSTEFVRYDPDKLLVNYKEWDVVSLPLPDFTGDGTVDFEDFFRFADHFGQDVTTTEVQKYDLDWDGKISFGDFFLFADQFGDRL
ncbi:MAG: M64 family metallopeptidase [bacterium]|nr:M64 family metallopeptidase [bacterium]